MCKFTNRLFVVAALIIICSQVFIDAAIPRSNSKQKGDVLENLLKILSAGNDYDLHYDQRQKGEENLRIKLDGFFVELPTPESSEITILNDEILEFLGEEFLLGLGRNRLTTTTAPDFYSYNRLDSFEQKNENEGKKTDKQDVEVPAPKKDNAPIRYVEAKVAEVRKPTRPKFRIGELLGKLLKLRALAEKKDKV